MPHTTFFRLNDPPEKQPEGSGQSTDLMPMQFPVEIMLNGSVYHTHIAGWISAPDPRIIQRAPGAPGCWMVCIPGASYSGRSYYDRQVPGHPSDEYSLVRALARSGIGAVLIDTLGTGESACTLSGQRITRAVTTQVNQQVVAQIQSHLLCGSLHPQVAAADPEQLHLFVMGHSLGAYQALDLVCSLQLSGRPLGGLIVAGMAYEQIVSEMSQLAPSLLDLPMVHGYASPDREQMHPFFFHPTLPPQVIEADDADAVAVPAGLLTGVLSPDFFATMREQAGQITCPVLHILAEYDMSEQLAAQLACYTHAPLVTGYSQPDAAHCNFEESRIHYWHVLATWVLQIATLSGVNA